MSAVPRYHRIGEIEKQCEGDSSLHIFTLENELDALARQLEALDKSKSSMGINILQEDNAKLQGKVGQLERQLAEAQQRIAALEAREQRIEMLPSHHQGLDDLIPPSLRYKLKQAEAERDDYKLALEAMRRDRDHWRETAQALDGAIEERDRLREQTSTHIAWLIESNDGSPFYYDGRSEWTTDASKAIRFPSKEAAQHIITELQLYKHLEECNYRDPHPVEHGFDYTPMTLLEENESLRERVKELEARHGR